VHFGNIGTTAFLDDSRTEYERRNSGRKANCDEYEDNPGQTASVRAAIQLQICVERRALDLDQPSLLRCSYAMIAG
jgi:hypothetical protein